MISDGKRDDNQNKGAGLLLSDSAHWFLADCGQGVNAGLEDVNQLMGVLQSHRYSATLAEDAVAYEVQRSRDVNALL